MKEPTLEEQGATRLRRYAILRDGLVDRFPDTVPSGLHKQRLLSLLFEACADACEKLEVACLVIECCEEQAEGDPDTERYARAFDSQNDMITSVYHFACSALYADVRAHS